MKLGVLFSGGKDSTYSAYLAKKAGHELVCLLSVESENKESFMFHTPSIQRVADQSKVMDIPLLTIKTKGKKEKELDDLTSLIKNAKKKYKIEGIVTGAVMSVYQSSRIQKICHELDLEVFNPLWQKNQTELLNDLIKHTFDIMLVGVFAYPLDKTWLGRKIDKGFVRDVERLEKDFGFNVAGEGGEYETFVLHCPLFTKKLTVKTFEDVIEGEHSARREVELT